MNSLPHRRSASLLTPLFGPSPSPFGGPRGGIAPGSGGSSGSEPAESGIGGKSVRSSSKDFLSESRRRCSASLCVFLRGGIVVVDVVVVAE